MENTSHFNKVPTQGQINLIIGPMFSGKTTELFKRLDNQYFAKKKILLIKYSFDTRYTQQINLAATHSKMRRKAVSCQQIAEIKDKYKQYDVIGIDEGQFFPDVVQMADKMAGEGKKVIVSALSGTFQRKPFGRILELVPLAEDILKLRSVCKVCFERADFSQRIIDNQEIEVIGGSESYIPVCRKCFNQGPKINMKKIKQNQIRQKEQDKLEGNEYDPNQGYLLQKSPSDGSTTSSDD